MSAVPAIPTQVASGGIDAAEFAERKETWRRAYLNTPHGKAIELSAADGYRTES